MAQLTQAGFAAVQRGNQGCDQIAGELLVALHCTLALENARWNPQRWRHRRAHQGCGAGGWVGGLPLQLSKSLSRIRGEGLGVHGGFQG